MVWFGLHLCTLVQTNIGSDKGKCDKTAKPNRVNLCINHITSIMLWNNLIPHISERSHTPPNRLRRHIQLQWQVSQELGLIGHTA